MKSSTSSLWHYNDVIMDTIASQITSLMIFNSAVYSDADQRKHQSSTSLVFVWGIHRSLVNSLHRGPVTRKCFHLMTSSCPRKAFDDVINSNKLCIRLALKHVLFCLLTHWVRDKMVPFCRHFQTHFLQWKCLKFDWDFTGICSSGSN